MPRHLKGGECLELSDWIIRSGGSECSDMQFECFPAIRTDHLHRAFENSDLGSPCAVVIHVGTNDLRRTGKFYYVMGDVHDLVNTAKSKFLKSRLVLSGVLQRRDVSWRRIGVVISRYEWVVNALEVAFVDLNSSVDDWDFGSDGLQINRRGARHLVQLYSRVFGIGSGRQKMRSE